MDDEDKIIMVKKKFDVVLWISIVLVGVLFFCAYLILKPKDHNFTKTARIDSSVSRRLFFPKETALRDGYRVTTNDWFFLSTAQKRIFVIEGIEEIKNKESCSVKNIADIEGFMNGFDKAMQVYSASGGRIVVISVLFHVLDYGGALKCNKTGFLAMKEKIMKNMNNADLPTVELGKTYIGYTDFYEKDGNWFMGKIPPAPGEICRHFIYSNYTGYPSGLVLLSGYYPLDFAYKINSIKEINSFLQSDGLTVHYFEVTFECTENREIKR